MMRLVAMAMAGVLTLGGTVATAGGQSSQLRCKQVHGDLVEDRATVGCKPGHPDCFLGEVDGNRGFRGTTYFRADVPVAAGPRTSPGFISYSGLFDYILERGTITARETGVFDVTTGRPSSGALTAYHQVIDATGEYAGASGYFFVSGFNRNNHVVTQIVGQLCLPE